MTTPTSNAVADGLTAGASDYNNLRQDVIEPNFGHEHDGTVGRKILHSNTRHPNGHVLRHGHDEVDAHIDAGTNVHGLPTNFAVAGGRIGRQETEDGAITLQAGSIVMAGVIIKVTANSGWQAKTILLSSLGLPNMVNYVVSLTMDTGGLDEGAAYEITVGARSQDRFAIDYVYRGTGPKARTINVIVMGVVQ